MYKIEFFFLSFVFIQFLFIWLIQFLQLLPLFRPQLGVNSMILLGKELHNFPGVALEPLLRSRFSKQPQQLHVIKSTYYILIYKYFFIWFKIKSTLNLCSLSRKSQFLIRTASLSVTRLQVDIQRIIKLRRLTVSIFLRFASLGTHT